MRITVGSVRNLYFLAHFNSVAVPLSRPKLARHSTITLTLDYYTHVLVDDERAAVEKMPEIGDGEDERREAG